MAEANCYDRIVQRQAAVLCEPRNDRRNHGLRERAHSEAALHGNRRTRSRIRDSVTHKHLNAVAQDADAAPGIRWEDACSRRRSARSCSVNPATYPEDYLSTRSSLIVLSMKSMIVGPVAT
jgi:hypothetical protein